MTERLYTFKKKLVDEGIILCFSGIISQDSLVGLITSIEKKLSRFEEMYKTQSIFSVFVEMIQNIMSYSSDSIFIDTTKKESSGLVILGYDTNINKYFIISGNSIAKNTEEEISKRIDSVKNLSKEDLKALYKEVRRSRKDMHDRGGGLGFIEIQRKSSEPLEYGFNKIDEKNSFFCLKSVI